MLRFNVTVLGLYGSHSELLPSKMNGDARMRVYGKRDPCYLAQYVQVPNCIRQFLNARDPYCTFRTKEGGQLFWVHNGCMFLKKNYAHPSGHSKMKYSPGLWYADMVC